MTMSRHGCGVPSLFSNAALSYGVSLRTAPGRFYERAKRAYKHQSASPYRGRLETSCANQLVELCPAEPCSLACLGNGAGETLREGNFRGIEFRASLRSVWQFLRRGGLSAIMNHGAGQVLNGSTKNRVWADFGFSVSAFPAAFDKPEPDGQSRRWDFGGGRVSPDRSAVWDQRSRRAEPRRSR